MKFITKRSSATVDTEHLSLDSLPMRSEKLLVQPKMMSDA